METKMEPGVIWGYSGSRVYNQCLHWALKSVNIVYAGLFGFLGFVSTAVPGPK